MTALTIALGIFSLILMVLCGVFYAFMNIFLEHGRATSKALRKEFAEHEKTLNAWKKCNDDHREVVNKIFENWRSSNEKIFDENQAILTDIFENLPFESKHVVVNAIGKLNKKAVDNNKNMN